MLYWYNSFSWWCARGCSKHVENWNKYIEKNCASSWSFTKIHVRGRGILSMSSKKGSLPINNARYVSFFLTRLVEEPLLGFLLISPSFPYASQCPCSVVFVYPYLFRNHVIPQAWHICPKSEYRHFVSYRTVWMWPGTLCILLKVETPVVTVCTTRFNVEIFYVLPTQCIYILSIDLRKNSGFRRVHCKLLFVTAMEIVYCLERTGSSVRKDCSASLKG
jgi:hypothetical protein